MPRANVSRWGDLAIEVEYDTFGDPADPPVLLVMGFTAQMTGWEEGFCRAIAERGRLVIRFDNRDCGLSTKLDGVEADMAALMGALAAGDHSAAPAAPYSLSDFSDDAFGLLSHLGIESAHIVGASMGGMIVQTMAIERPERVRSMTSIMSTTGEPEYGQGTPEAMGALLAPPAPDRAAMIEQAARLWKVWSSKTLFDPDKARQRAAEGYDRSFYPEGAPRQLAAIITSGPRTEGLRSLQVPTLVIHGQDDALIQPSGGERTAELVPGAELMLVEHMGHDMPEPLWPKLVDAIVKHTDRST
jgi:pimeloyl-ACP methyl ester carboxylesterase